MDVVCELEHNRKLFHDHSPSILHGALVGASSLWPLFSGLGLELLGYGGGGILSTSVARAVGPSVTVSSTDFSFQNLIFWNLFGIFSARNHF
jgi:hypothetical protein